MVWRAVKRVLAFELKVALAVADFLAPIPPDLPEWHRRGASVTVNGTDLATPVGAKGPTRARVRGKG